MQQKWHAIYCDELGVQDMVRVRGEDDGRAVSILYISVHAYKGQVQRGDEPDECLSTGHKCIYDGGGERGNNFPSTDQCTPPLVMCWAGLGLKSPGLGLQEC